MWLKCHKHYVFMGVKGEIVRKMNNYKSMKVCV